MNLGDFGGENGEKLKEKLKQKTKKRENWVIENWKKVDGSHDEENSY